MYLERFTEKVHIPVYIEKEIYIWWKEILHGELAAANIKFLKKNETFSYIYLPKHQGTVLIIQKNK